ncbi:MAG TPA: FAD-dependent oxidoreductase [Bryobacteraceae bacterium]|nr:FAD-dependent oxidoreductase [Bryobacteraceae bacterium]
MQTVISVDHSRAQRSHSVSGSPDCDVAIIGAGPYGLSAAAHLKAEGVGVRVFGEPMEFWANTMPEGMLLRSPRVASNLSDPKAALSLDAYEAACGLKPVAPVPLNHFVEYGRWFQRQLGSILDRSTVANVAVRGSAFAITLEDGSVVRSRRVVVATGVGPFNKKPDVFAGLSAQQVSHCYEGRKVSELAKKRVAVIGAGQSALESAAILYEAGGEVEVIARIPALRFIGQHDWLHNLGPISKMLYSPHDIGPAGISKLVASPQIVHHVPLGLRDKIRKRAVRPAGAKWLPARLEKLKITTGQTVRSARSAGGEIQLTLTDGTERRVDHVLLGTGYQVDIAKYKFLSQELVQATEQLEGSPKLAPGFGSSVPGLHFIGAAAARSFGPLLYFVAGTEFAAQRLAAYIARNRVNVQ